MWDDMPPGTNHISKVAETGVKKRKSIITNFMVPLKQSSTNTLQKLKKLEESKYELWSEESEESDKEKLDEGESKEEIELEDEEELVEKKWKDKN